MKTSHYTDQQMLGILKQNQAGVRVDDLCRKHGMSSATFYNWGSKYGGIDLSLTETLESIERHGWL